METSSTWPSPAFVPDALAASSAGAWEYDVDVDIFRCDAFVASLHGLTPQEAASGVSAERFLQAVYPEDLKRSQQHRDRIRREGGVYVFEARVTPRPDVMRWVLVRGAFGLERDGVMRGRGILLDVTNSKMDGYVEGHAVFGSTSTPETPLEIAADHAIAARKAIEMLGASGDPVLRSAVDVLLLLLGQRLASVVDYTD